MEEKPGIDEKLIKLEEKYLALGQDMVSYLDGLLYSNYLTYWDYIHLDTLLSLQNTRTDFPDELIFITYHQHTELFFKLILSEINQISNHPSLSPDFFLERVNRINCYMEILVNSFAVMVEGHGEGTIFKIQDVVIARQWFSISPIPHDRNLFY